MFSRNSLIKLASAQKLEDWKLSRKQFETKKRKKLGSSPRNNAANNNGRFLPLFFTCKYCEWLQWRKKRYIIIKRVK